MGQDGERDVLSRYTTLLAMCCVGARVLAGTTGFSKVWRYATFPAFLPAGCIRASFCTGAALLF